MSWHVQWCKIVRELDMWPPLLKKRAWGQSRANWTLIKKTMNRGLIDMQDEDKSVLSMKSYIERTAVLQKLIMSSGHAFSSDTLKRDGATCKHTTCSYSSHVVRADGRKKSSMIVLYISLLHTERWRLYSVRGFFCLPSSPNAIRGMEDFCFATQLSSIWCYSFNVL